MVNTSNTPILWVTPQHSEAQTKISGIWSWGLRVKDVTSTGAQWISHMLSLTGTEYTTTEVIAKPVRQFNASAQSQV